MAIKLTQSLKQTQTLMMTPQLKQAIEMLTLAHLDMVQMISKELMENPMLEELDEGDRSTLGPSSELDARQENIEQASYEATVDHFEQPEIVASARDEMDWNQYYESTNPHSSTPAGPSMVGAGDPDDQNNLENLVAQESSLETHLFWQMNMIEMNDEERAFAQALIYNLDENGFIAEATLEDLLQQSTLEREDALEVLKIVQALDPVGCATFNMEQCLLVQAQNLTPLNPLIVKMIERHLPALAAKELEQIAQTERVPLARVESALATIQTFHLRPGKLITSERSQYVVPDIYIGIVEGRPVISMNMEGLPRLAISPLYYELAKQKGQTDAATQAYVQEKFRGAMWLLKSLQNRQRTIYRVTEVILQRQPDFFLKGPEYLRPLILKDVADELGVHESTVSRATVNKFMHTPRGTFELKYFFNSGLGKGSGGVELSAEALKIKIKNMIEHEDCCHPLSDQQIAEQFGRDGVVVARRTVAKYREMLGISSSSDRKKRDLVKGKSK